MSAKREVHHRMRPGRLAMLLAATTLASVAMTTGCRPRQETGGTNGAPVVAEVEGQATRPRIGADGQPVGPGTPSIQDLATARAMAIDNATAAAPATVEARAERDSEYTAEVAAEIGDVVADLFAVAVGEREVEIEDVVVRRMSTSRLARLRRSATPEPGAFARAPGDVWVVGFRTSLAVTPEAMVVDNFPELLDVPATAFPDEDGLTAVYYVLSVTPRGDGYQYTPLARGLLPATGATWRLEDLRAIPEG